MLGPAQEFKEFRLKI